MTLTEISATHTKRPALPEEKLWQKVLQAGLADSEWLATTDFSLVCSLAGADPGYLRRKLGC